MKELFNTILMIAIAMLLGGVINRVRSVLSGRRGPSIVQHLHNVALLARKGSVYSPTTSALFRVAPAVYMGSALLALLFIPIGNLDPLLSFRGDVVVFAYLLGLGRLSLVLAAMDTGSSFEGMGASQYYDAAKVDGTSRARTLWRITVPLLSPMIAYVVITGFIGGFKEYTSIVGIFGEKMGPADDPNRLDTMVGLIYDLIDSNQGKAAAGALILFAIILAVTLINLQVSKSACNRTGLPAVSGYR